MSGNALGIWAYVGPCVPLLVGIVTMTVGGCDFGVEKAASTSLLPT